MATKKRKLNEDDLLRVYEASLEDMYITHQIVKGKKGTPCEDCAFVDWKRGDSCYIIEADDGRTHLCKTCVLDRAKSFSVAQEAKDPVNVEAERKRLSAIVSNPSFPTSKLRSTLLTILSQSDESLQIASNIFPPATATKTCTRCDEEFDPRFNSDTSCVLEHEIDDSEGAARGSCTSSGWDCYHRGCERCSPGIPEYDDSRPYHCSYKNKWVNSEYLPASVCFRGEHITYKFTMEYGEEIPDSESE